MDIIPSILVNSGDILLAQARAIEEVVSMIQIDIADGQFVPNTTWAYSEDAPEEITKHLNIDCELHLMVNDPLDVARAWELVPQVKRVLAHYESAPDNIAEILSQIHSYGWEVGVVLNPDTDIAVVDPFIEELDAVMFMGVVPGKQGQSFIPSVLDRMRALREKYPDLYIELDGAVNMETVEGIVKAGANAVCPGSAIFGNENVPAKNVVDMRDFINTLTQKE